MLKVLKRLFGDGATPSPGAHYIGVKDGAITEEEIPRYPPFVRGLPLCSPAQILETQQELIARIRGTLGLSPEEHKTLILPLIENAASFVHLLPASEAHHHRGAGGLFRHSLEVGAWAAQFAEGRIFTFGKTPLERKKEEPRWVVATFVAAFVHDIGKAASDMAVVSGDGSSEWSPYMESLWEWGQRNKVDRYFVRWRENRHKKHEQTGLLLVNQVLPMPLKAWLGEFNPEIIQTMLEATTCKGEHVLTQIVVRADSTSVEKDVKTNRTLGTEVSVGVPVERHLLDASRRLIGNGTWTVNKKGSRVWVTREGVFIVWKTATEEMVNLLSEDRVPGIPRDKDTLADLLLERDLARWNDKEEPDHPKRYWSISPAVLDGRNGPLWLQCLKIADVELLFSSEPPASAKVLLKGADGEEILIDGSVGAELAPVEGEDGEDDKAQTAPEKPAKKKQEAPGQAKGGDKPGMRLPGAAEPEAPAQASPAEPKKEPEGDAHKQAELALPTPTAPVTPAVAIDTPAQAESNEIAAAEKWLKEQSNEAANLLLKMLEEVGLGIKTAPQLFGEEDGVVYLRYPDAVRPYGKPSDISQSFSQAGWVIPDPENPMRKAREMSDGRGLVMSAEIADRIRALLRRSITPKDEPKPTPKPASKKVAPPAAAKAATEKPAQKTEPKPTPVTPTRDRSQQAPAGDQVRPPSQDRAIPEEVHKIVEQFVIQVRAGRISSVTKPHRGAQYAEVGMAQLSRFTKEFPPTVVRSAVRMREDCHMDHLYVWVKAE